MNRRVATAAAWIAAATVLVGSSVVAIEVADSDEEQDLVDRLFPIEVGNSWVYETERDGESSGLRTLQVVGTALLAGSELGEGATNESIVEGYILRSDFENYIGTGRPQTRVEYVRRQDDRLVGYGQRENGGPFEANEPPYPIVMGDLEPASTARFDGTVGGDEVTAAIELVAFEDVDVGETSYERCAHVRTEFTFPQEGGDPLLSTADEWLCPGIGRVKSSEVSDDGSFSYSEELVDHSLKGPIELDGSLTPSLDPNDAEVGGVSGGGTRANRADETVDLDALAYSHTSNGSALFPPVGAGGVNILAEEDGNVTGTDARTGDLLWRLRLSGPAVAPVEIGAGAAFVADTEKRLLAVGLHDGLVRWRASFDDVVSAAPAIAAGNVIVPTEDGGIHALDIVTGESEWTGEHGGTIEGAPAVAGDLVIFADTSDGIVAYNATDGEIAWTHEPEDVASSGPVVVGDRVVFGDAIGEIRAVSTADGAELWDRGLGAYSILSVPVAADSETVFYVIETGAGRVLLNALSLTDGRVLWRTDVGEDVENPPAVVGDRVVIVTEGGRVVAFDAVTGEEIQERSLPALEDGVDSGRAIGPALQGDLLTASVVTDAPYSQTTYFSFDLVDRGGGARLDISSRQLTESPSAGPVLIGDEAIFPTYGGGIVAVDPAGEIRRVAKTAQTAVFLHRAERFLIAPDKEETIAVRPQGGIAWRFPSGEIGGGVRVDHAGDLLFIPVGQALAAVDEASGEPRWLHPAVGRGIGTPLALPDGDVIYGVGEMARLNGATGDVEWSIPQLETLNPAAGGDDDPLVVMGFDFARDEVVLLGLDPETGTELWRHPFETPLFVGPAVGDGIAVAPNNRGELRAYVADTGAEMWKVRLTTPLAISPAIVDGRVYVLEGGRLEDLTAHEFRLRVFEASSGSLLASYEAAGASGRVGDVSVDDSGVVALTSALRLLLIETEEW